MAEHPSDAHVEDHSSFIQTPTQLVVVILLAFVVPIAVISMLAMLVTSGGKFNASHPAMTEVAIAQRIQPVAKVSITDPNAPKVEKSGEEVYKQVCAACHATGALNAPKVGDKAAWAKLIKEGLEVLTADAIKGIRQMPPRGGNPELSDLEMRRTIVFMANESGANWKAPEAPPATAAPAAPSGATPVQAAGAPAPAPAAAPAPAKK
jgi:cytochrome c5